MESLKRLYYTEKKYYRRNKYTEKKYYRRNKYYTEKQVSDREKVL